MKIVPAMLEVCEIPVEYVGLFLLIGLFLIIALIIDGNRN